MNLIELNRRARSTAEEVETTIIGQTEAEHVAVADIEAQQTALQASIERATRSTAEVDAKIDDARRRRGVNLADGAPTATIDKELGALHCERERLQDLSSTLSERFECVESDLSRARRALFNAKYDAIMKALERAKGDAIEAKEVYEVAVALRDTLQRKVDSYAMATASLTNRDSRI